MSAPNRPVWAQNARNSSMSTDPPLSTSMVSKRVLSASFFIELKSLTLLNSSKSISPLPSTSIRANSLAILSPWYTARGNLPGLPYTLPCASRSRYCNASISCFVCKVDRLCGSFSISDSWSWNHLIISSDFSSCSSTRRSIWSAKTICSMTLSTFSNAASTSVNALVTRGLNSLTNQSPPFFGWNL